MTELVQKMISEISKLPEQQQDSLAAWILEELASDQKWTELFDNSQDIYRRS
jgi:hypothetical protein